MSDYAELKARLLAPCQREFTYDADKEEAAVAIDALERDRDVLTKAGIVEIASRNNRVTEYMFYWEERALVAEARMKELQAALLEIANQTAGVTPEPDNLQMAIGSIHSFARAALQEDKSHE